jgi:hypothetical protein
MIDIQPTGTGERFILYPCTERAVIWLKANVNPDQTNYKFANSVRVRKDQFRFILKWLQHDGLRLPPLTAKPIDVRSEFHGNLIDFYPVSEKGREWLLQHLPDDPWPAAYGNRHRIPHRQAGLLFQALAQAGLTVS